MIRLGVLLLALLALAAEADERILRFHSTVEIATDGWITVTEEIAVQAEGNRIRRGIYRELPTTYEDRYGNTVNIVYEPLSVLRNDARENFFSEELSNGRRTYFGSADRALIHGEHRYVFRYRANRMLGFFEDHDELYWNVTGNGWDFPIESASATVRLDFADEPEILEADAWTGYTGDQGKDLERAVTGATARFETTRVLSPHEGLTVVVAWPKGFVTAPSGLDRLGWLLKDNANLLVTVAGLIGMLIYLIPVWNAFGRDPEEGVIVTRYEPPVGLSPGSLRYINQMYYDNKVTTAAVVNLAVKGYLSIQEADDTYTLVRQQKEPGSDLSNSERALLAALFEDGSQLILDDKYHKRVGGARLAHRRALAGEFRGHYFRTNGILGLPALAIGIASGVIALRVGSGATPMVVGGLVLMLLVYALFAVIMRKPTALGRTALDDMLGFRDYLDIAEKDELNLRNPPEKTPALFEKFLPYALALGVEQNWAERFSSVFAQVQASTTSAYKPGWYSGSWNSFNLRATTAAMSGSLGSAISSSASPPGSSSGGGGGGSSGGGGGGGGGGGW